MLDTVVGTQVYLVSGRTRLHVMLYMYTYIRAATLISIVISWHLSTQQQPVITHRYEPLYVLGLRLYSACHYHVYRHGEIDHQQHHPYTPALGRSPASLAFLHTRLRIFHHALYIRVLHYYFTFSWACRGSTIAPPSAYHVIPTTSHCVA